MKGCENHGFVGSETELVDIVQKTSRSEDRNNGIKISGKEGSVTLESPLSLSSRRSIESPPMMAALTFTGPPLSPSRYPEKCTCTLVALSDFDDGFPEWKVHDDGNFRCRSLDYHSSLGRHDVLRKCDTNIKYSIPTHTSCSHHDKVSSLSSSSVSVVIKDNQVLGKKRNCGAWNLHYIPRQLIRDAGNWNFLNRRRLKPRKLLSFFIKYLITYPLLSLAIWTLLYIFWGESAFPGGSLFAISILFIASFFTGKAVSLLGLPPLFGMLIAGIALRNVPYISIGGNLTSSISSPLRGISVVILLTRGAFSVNPLNIYVNKRVIPSLAIGSCIIEAICGSIAAYFIIGFPIAWAALIGCIFSAMSGAAVMPYLLNIEKNIQEDSFFCTEYAQRTILIAKTACGLDAILAICLAECAFGFIFGEGIQDSLLKGLAEVGMGGAWGIAWGGASGLLLSKEENSDLKIMVIFSGGVMSLLGLPKIGYPRGGPLGVFSGTLLAIFCWRRQKVKGLNNLTETFDKLWIVFQPLLFGIIGIRTELQSVDWNIIYKGVICLGICLVSRIIGSYLMTQWSGLPFRERVFLVMSWVGKGTVQAALGPVALDTAIDLQLLNHQTLGNQVMNLAVLAILIPSVLSAILLKLFGTKMLSS